MDKHRAWISRLSQVDWEHRAREAEFAPATMAAICFISLRQLERVFAHRFQCTLREWVRNYRFKLAKDLLAQGHSSKAVAAELNFGSPAHFCHQFKKFYGVPPSDFCQPGSLKANPRARTAVRGKLVRTCFENGFRVDPGAPEPVAAGYQPASFRPGFSAAGCCRK